ncbi:patatin-like phospholipase family protein [Marinobacter sp. F4216]|uniref:patatin-like phospholipase family protein n=1 Tax=Marinobacter sp. F4216 TaxID=2874281 RepID=UPI001CBFC146|nr:patatin-like phospholipase family protein [Marinobacter sp. F4216]MBZ2170324.1 patatin-like phospholipase family protein [Marinobacter sp. F4216]
MPVKRILFWIFLTGAWLAPVLSAAERPKVGLVLSGGGAKGMAHVGVLRVLEEMNIPVDVVVGTSAGAAVGALYASGMSVKEIETRFLKLDWVSSFKDDPGRIYKPVRRKMEEVRLPLMPGIGVAADGFRVGGGIVAGQNLGFILNELTRDDALVEDFDLLAIPYRAVATDLETGEQVVMGKGNLAEAVRASMSIPGVYAPVRRDGRLLVDGGVANNLPISVAQDLGAEIIIAVDISDALMGRDELTGAFSVVGQLTTMMTRSNTDEQLTFLGERDVLIQPDLEGYTSADFYDGLVLFELGASAAREHAVELRPLSVSKRQWSEYQERRDSGSFRVGRVASINIIHGNALASKFIRERIRQQEGMPLQVGLLEEDLKRIYGLGYYETVSYSVSPSPDGNVLNILIQEKSWGPNYLSFGLGYEDSVDGDTRFNLAGGLTLTELNDLGAEWATGLQVGTEPWIRSQWYQPLNYGYERFLVVGGEYDRDIFGVYDGGSDPVAELEVNYRLVDVALGMEFGSEHEVRLKYFRGDASIENVVGQVAIEDDDIQQGGISLQWVHDSLDDSFYPYSGAFAGLRGRMDRDGLGSERSFDAISGIGLGTDTWQGFNLTGLFYGEIVTRGEPGIENAARLGGFRRLSALGPGQISGDNALMAAMFGRKNFGGPVVPVFAGAGFEVGNAWESLSDASWGNSVRSWSLFAGVDTFLGPVQVAAAYSNLDTWSVYLNIGYSFTELFYDSP